MINFRVLFATIGLGLIPFLQHNKYAEIMLLSLVDAYLGVTIFVAITLLLLLLAERWFKFKLNEFNKHNPHLQVLVSGFLGALPGCGGAIIVLTKYLENHVSFGSIVAALTATMGDAAFLLISKKPLVGLGIVVISFFVGIISGYLVDWIHGPHFLKNPKMPEEAIEQYNCKILNNCYEENLSWLHIAWLIVLLPGIILGIMKTVYYGIEETNHIINVLMQFVGFVGAYLSLISYIKYKHNITGNCNSQMSCLNRIINDTNFITFWVICSFVSYSYVTELLGIDIVSFFDNSRVFLPLIAILIGFIPGCGPQIIVTTLYVNNMIPLSAQIGNAISNDGDALFPAIAMAPKASIIATIYSAIPAFIVSYLSTAIFMLLAPWDQYFQAHKITLRNVFSRGHPL